MTMKTVNLDDMPPKELLRDIEEHERLKDQFRHKNTGRIPAKERKWLAKWPVQRRNERLKATSLLDWRKVERRSNELWQQYMSWRGVLYSTLENVLKKGRSQALEGATCDEVWVMHPTDKERVLVYQGHGCWDVSWHTTTELVNQKSRSSNANAMPVVLNQSDSVKVYRLHQRENSFYRRYCAYRGALTVAVEVRIEPYAKEHLSQKHPQIQHMYRDGVFAFENEGRSYIVTTDQRGKFNWLDGDLFVSP